MFLFLIYIFIFDNRARILENSGPIGLALMVVISESFLQHLEGRAMQEALAKNFALLTDKRYVDDSHARFETAHESHSFLNILNKQNKTIHNGKRRSITKTELFRCYNYKHWCRGIEFKIHRKNAITNAQIKPQSYVNPALIRGVFKGFVSRAKKLCSDKISRWGIKFSCRYVC